jgi:hypothetical protein
MVDQPSAPEWVNTQDPRGVLKSARHHRASRTGSNCGWAVKLLPTPPVLPEGEKA